MRLIDADALAKKMFSHNYCVPVLENEQKVLSEALRMVHEAPTVTPSLNLDNITEEDIEKFKMIWQRANSKGLLAINEERPQGEWLHPYTTNIACECSNCHMQMPITDYYNFCPNCGAWMEGGAEE